MTGILASKMSPKWPAAKGSDLELGSDFDLEIAAPARMMTMNWERAAHHYFKAEVVGAWRYAAKVEALAAKIPPHHRVDIECWPMQARGVLADTGAHMPVLKACVDGLRDAGVLSDDTGTQVASVIMHAPVRGPDGVRLGVREHEDPA